MRSFLNWQARKWLWSPCPKSTQSSPAVHSDRPAETYGAQQHKIRTLPGGGGFYRPFASPQVPEFPAESASLTPRPAQGAGDCFESVEESKVAACGG